MGESMKIAYVFPGQGCQFVGMGRDIYDNFESAKEIYKQADESLGFSLSRLCFEGPEDELGLTINAQPAIVTTSIAYLTVAQEVNGGKAIPSADVVAGHSLGEYTALAAADVFDFSTAVYLAKERGRLMHEAALNCQPGGMVAVIGLDEPVLQEVCDSTGTWIANVNCPGQMVISGTHDNLNKAMELAKEKGAYRTVPLKVSGPFHTTLIQSASDGMAKVIAALDFNEPTVPVIANTTAQPMNTVQSIKEELVRQVCNGIQWQQSVEYMITEGVTKYIEIGPGKVVSGLIKRISKDVDTLNIGDIQAIKDLA
ncbi:ACP S-malonyltransferase [Chloroflexota bacterium]